MLFGVHIQINRLTRVAFVSNAVEAGSSHRRLQQVWIGRTVHEPNLETARIGNTHHVSTIVTGVCNSIRRPRRTGCSNRRVDAFVTVDGWDEYRGHGIGAV